MGGKGGILVLCLALPRASQASDSLSALRLLLSSTFRTRTREYSQTIIINRLVRSTHPLSSDIPSTEPHLRYVAALRYICLTFISDPSSLTSRAMSIICPSLVSHSPVRQTKRETPQTNRPNDVCRAGASSLHFHIPHLA